MASSDNALKFKVSLPSLTAVLFFILYVKTACPTCYWHDSGIYSRAVNILGNCYPPGYPVYICWCYIFTCPSPLAGLNYASAFWGAVAVWFVATCAVKVFGEDSYGGVGAIVAACGFGLAPAFWSQATVAEVYTMHFALVAATFFLLWLWYKSRDARFVYAAAFVFGLGLGVHLQNLVFLPVFVGFVLVAGRRAVTWRSVLVAGAAFLLAASAYLYLPIRSAVGAAMDWGKPDVWSRFIYHVTARAYAKESSLGNWALAGLRARVGADVFQQQFGWLGVGVGLVGAVWFFIRRRAAAFLFFGSAAASVVFILNYDSANWRTYYVPVYLAWAMAIGAFVVCVARRFTRTRVLAGGVAICSVVASLSAAVIRFGPADRSATTFAADAAANVLRSLAPRPTFFTSYEGSGLLGPIAALYTARKGRVDVEIVDAIGTRVFQDIYDHVRGGYDVNKPGPFDQPFVGAFVGILADDKREYYMLYPYPPARWFGFGYERNGIVWRVVRPGAARREEERDWWALYKKPPCSEPPAYVDYWSAASIGYLFETAASYFHNKGDVRKAAVYALRAEQWGAKSELVQNNLGVLAAERGDVRAAISHFRRALALNPLHEEARLNLVRAYYRVGEGEAAARELKILEKLSPKER